MSVRYLALGALLPACAGAGIQTGAIVSPASATSAPAPTGVELRVWGGTPLKDPAMPNAYGWQVRQLGEDIQYSAQVGWMEQTHVGQAVLFGKLMFDLLGVQKTAATTDAEGVMHGESERLSAFSPTIDFGIAPWGHGLCFSGSGTWDVHFNEPDRLIVGLFVGLCSGRIR